MTDAMTAPITLLRGESVKDKTIVVWFSCGAASAVAAKLAVDMYGADNNVMVVNNPIKEEHPDNLRFKRDVEKWLGVEIIDAINPKFPNHSIVEVFDKRKYMSGVAGAPCTQLLKKEARYNFELTHEIDFHVLGFTADERHRHERFVKFERPNVLPLLIDAGYTKGDCFNIIESAGIKLPEVYRSLPNANCIGCVKSSSPTYWNIIRRNFPEQFKERAEQSRRIGCKLVKVRGERIFLDELKPTDRGGKISNYECGIFCDMY